MSKYEPSKKTIKNLEELRKKQNKAIYNFNYRNKNAPKLETVKKKDLFGKIESKDDIKKIRTELKEPINKRVLTTEENAKITVGDYKELKHNVYIINKRREKYKEQIEKTDVTLRGEKIGIKRGQMDDDRTGEYKPKPFNITKKSQKELEKYIETVNKEIKDKRYNNRNELFKTNYISSLVENGLSEEIIRFVTGVPAEFIVRNYYADENINIDFIYDTHIDRQYKEKYIFDSLKEFTDIENETIPLYWL